MAEASGAAAAAEISGHLDLSCSKGGMQYKVVHNQVNNGTKGPPKPSASSSSKGPSYFIYAPHPHQVGFAVSDVEIKSKLDLRGTQATKEVFAARAAKRRAAS
jgi:hypothetical protein